MSISCVCYVYVHVCVVHANVCARLCVFVCVINVDHEHTRLCLCTLL
jgi:hypothetical protein